MIESRFMKKSTVINVWTKRNSKMNNDKRYLKKIFGEVSSPS